MIWFKGKLLAILAGSVAVLLFIVKVLAASRKKAIKQAKQFKAVIKRKEETEEADTELSKDLSSRKAKIKQEISEGKPVKSLEKPNEDW